MNSKVKSAINTYNQEVAKSKRRLIGSLCDLYETSEDCNSECCGCPFDKDENPWCQNVESRDIPEKYLDVILRELIKAHCNRADAF